MNMKFRPEQARRRHDLLSDLAESVAHELQQIAHLPAEDAEACGERVALAVHENWRGMTVTFPMWPELVRARLKKAVLDEWDGTNTVALVRKYHVAENTIYKWVAERDAARNRNQHQLFSEDE